jgi:hypothetical protein
MTDIRSNFNDCYARGRVGESLCARWLIHREGWSILPAYEIEIPSGKGPRLFTLDGKLIAPDIFAMKYQKKKYLFKWFEAKHKTRFTWHRISGNWQTGIDIKHYLDYIKVQEQTKTEVFALFLHNCSEPSKGDLAYGSPSICPTGLYGRPLSYLAEHEHHRDSYARGERNYPMVYWNETDLEKLATLDEVKVLPVSLWEGGAA